MSEQIPEIRSEDVQEILGMPPHWLVRWGSVMMGLVLLLLVFMAARWQYADEVIGDLILTSSNPPRQVLSKTEGMVEKLLVKEGRKVQQGEELVVMQSEANYSHMLSFEEHLDSLSKLNGVDLMSYYLPGSWQLGSVQKEYNELEQLISMYKRSNSQSLQGETIRELEKLIIVIDEEIAELTQQREGAIQSMREDGKVIKALNSRNNTGQFDGQIRDLKNSERILRSKVDNLYNDIKDKEREKTKINIQIREARNSASSSNKGLIADIQQRVASAKLAVQSWKNNYILTAPVEGSILLSDFYEEVKFYQKGMPILSIIMDKDSEIIGLATVPYEKANQVKEGQTVHLKLANFPAHRHGFLLGTVVSKKQQFQQGNYLVQIALQEGMRSSTGEVLRFEHRIKGTAEIITEKRSVLERLLGKAPELILE